MKNKEIALVVIITCYYDNSLATVLCLNIYIHLLLYLNIAIIFTKNANIILYIIDKWANILSMQLSIISRFAIRFKIILGEETGLS